jgi:tryptophan-rich sensory protein
MSGLIFGLGWDKTTDDLPDPPWAPRGYTVAVVWTFVLFPLMATARWLLNDSSKAVSARNSVTVLLISCIIWPLYTVAIGSVIGGLIGNILTIFLATISIQKAWRISKISALCVTPVVPWVSFATMIILYELGWIH